MVMGIRAPWGPGSPGAALRSWHPWPCRAREEPGGLGLSECFAFPPFPVKGGDSEWPRLQGRPQRCCHRWDDVLALRSGPTTARAGLSSACQASGGHGGLCWKGQPGLSSSPLLSTVVKLWAIPTAAAEGPERLGSLWVPSKPRGMSEQSSPVRGGSSFANPFPLCKLGRRSRLVGSVCSRTCTVCVYAWQAPGAPPWLARVPGLSRQSGPNHRAGAQGCVPGG